MRGDLDPLSTESTPPACTAQGHKMCAPSEFEAGHTRGGAGLVNCPLGGGVSQLFISLMFYLATELNISYHFRCLFRLIIELFISQCISYP